MNTYCNAAIGMLVTAALLLLPGCSETVKPSIANVHPSNAQITVLYDAFGKDPALQKDWGYAALIEYGGKRILFDTGNNADILAHNAQAMGVDLSRLDFVVMSHRHGDHMGGLAYLLEVNPKVKIYAPKENFGVYGFSLPSTFYRKEATLPPGQRYYDGQPPETMQFGNAWPGARFELIDHTTEIADGIHLIFEISNKPTTLELRELSLAIDTPDGIVLVVGCSHPGLGKILRAAAEINPHIHLVAGGYHLVVAEDLEIARTVDTLHRSYKVDYVAPSHCTGEPAFAALKRAFADHYAYAGLGTIIPLSHPAGMMAAAWDASDRASYRALHTRSEENSRLERS